MTDRSLFQKILLGVLPTYHFELRKLESWFIKEKGVSVEGGRLLEVTRGGFHIYGESTPEQKKHFPVKAWLNVRLAQYNPGILI